MKDFGSMADFDSLLTGLHARLVLDNASRRPATELLQPYQAAVYDISQQ